MFGRSLLLYEVFQNDFCKQGVEFKSIFWHLKYFGFLLFSVKQRKNKVVLVENVYGFEVVYRGFSFTH